MVFDICCMMAQLYKNAIGAENIHRGDIGGKP